MAEEAAREWTRLAGTPSNDSANSISTSTDGSIYIAGGTDGSLDGEANMGGTDGFIAKYNSDGSKLWTRMLGSSSYDIINSISTSADGSINVTGTTGGSFNGQVNTGSNVGSFDAFVAKYNRDGSEAWTRLLGSTSNDESRSIITANDGAIYIAGYTNGSFDGQTSNGARDAFVSMFSPDGQKVWTRFLGSPSSDTANSIGVDADGSIYVAGTTSGSFDGQINSGKSDAFISKFTSGGRRVWTRLLGSTENDEADSISIAADGSIYITGYTNGSFDGQVNRVFDNPLRQSDAFISKYNADGSKAWTRFYGTTGLDFSHSVATSADGSIYIAGYTAAYGGTVSQMGNNSDAFIIKYNNDGSRSWTQYLGSSTADAANSISTPANGSIYVAGTTSGSLDGQLHSGSSDAFVSKYSKENNLPTGKPSISGDLKIGSTLTIEASAIQDADNFTGYTPVYKYSWESSADGTTWTPLTTTDATDNNTTYTLTTTEVGKQIRGIVSYLDGYGTTEILNSDASIRIEAQIKQPIIRGNSIYTIVDGPSWTQAEANSVKLGGNLVTINDAEENVFLLTGSERAIKTLGGDGFYWLGIQDADDNGVYAWSSEQPAHFTSWFDGEPSGGDVNGPENYGFTINFLDDDQSEWQNGYWYDTTIDGNGQIPRGISEIPFIRRGDSAYVIVQGPTWEEAEANAVALGGHLVTINDAEENEWLMNSLAREINEGKESASWNAAWIGLTRSRTNNDSWAWVSGEPVNYTHWYRDSPFDLDYSKIYTSHGEAGHESAPGYWNGWDGSGWEGIAEIKLTPNKTPTGNPSISGDLKIGSTLTIEASDIQDADNFTRYTPTYQYAWESSSDGTTWNKINTTDATDQNNTYTLTTAEVGKQVRGVVSYVDGYGTQESIASAGSSIVTKPNRIPTDLRISSSSFNENIASGSIVAYLNSVDPDSVDSFSYDLVAGDGGTDNSYFSISRTGLIIKASPDFETKSSYNVRIRTQDSGGLSLEKAFTLSVNDVDETPIPTPPTQEPVANPGITVRSISGNNTTSEIGTSASYSFVLKSAPTDRVTITFTLSDGSEGSLSSNTLIFTPGNWDTAQTLTVTGLDDYENDGDIPYVISAVVSSDDPNYGRRRDGTGGVSISNIELVNEDDGLEKDLTIYGDRNISNYNDILTGNNGADRLYGDRGRDRLYGGRGGDRLYGGVDDDTLWGEDGDDELYGNEDDDTLYGGNGNDRLTGGEGYDLLTGGIGNDTYVIDDEFDIIDDQGLESDQDKVIIRGNITAYTLPQGIEGATLDGTVAKNLIGNAGNNELIGNANSNLIDGGEGSDYLYSASGDDSVFGGGGDDKIVGGDGKGDDAYDGGEGEDTVIYKSSERNPIEVSLRSGFAKGAEIGSDTLKDIEHIVAGQQDDLITGDARDNKIDGLAGRDTAVFQGLRSEYLVSPNSEGKIVVQDKLGGRDGVDTLSNVEFLKFADNTYNADEVLNGSKDASLGEGEHRGQGKGARIVTQVNQPDRVTLAPSSFKSSSPDIITGFLATEDKIVLPKAVFAKLKSTKLTTVSSKKQLKKSKSGRNSTQLVYNKMTGEVIYDENGKKKGLGAGGVIARFEDATLPILTASNFELG